MSEHYLDDVDYLLKQERKRTGAAFSEADQAAALYGRYSLETQEHWGLYSQASLAALLVDAIHEYDRNNPFALRQGVLAVAGKLLANATELELGGEE